MSKKKKITVQRTDISVISEREKDYISASAKEGAARAADIITNAFTG
jgi:hypothetical protein